MIYVSAIKADFTKDQTYAIEKACKKLGVGSGQILSAQISKVSVDARHQNKILLVYTVAIALKGNEQALVARLGDPTVRYVEKTPLQFRPGTLMAKHPIVVVGFGPAGMFCALTLAQQGYPVLVLERGGALEERVQTVNRFWQTGALDQNTNVQFGEGGAGTFSDGKLTTRISDVRCGYVIDQLLAHGAPTEIASKAKPHIGTDKLRNVVTSIRQTIVRLGGQVRFHTKVERLVLCNDRVCGVIANGQHIDASAVVLAIGHSARDTFTSLYEQGISMQPKPFSVGVRIEHTQQAIDRALFGQSAGHPALGKAEYQLSYRENGRGVYSFCMCPGGVVVPAASEQLGVVTNGMSEFARNATNANAAIVVSVTPQDFGAHPLDGVAFQRTLEQRAFLMGGGGYRAPAITVGNFLANKQGLDLKSVQPTYACGVTEADFDALLPTPVCTFLRKGLLQFGRKIRGFDTPDAVLTSVETRTSSPVRLPRDETLQAVGFLGLYPCGEGAGYAGGIMSAAVDGVRIAQVLIEQYRPTAHPSPLENHA